MATFLKLSHQSKLVTLRDSIFLHSKLKALYKKVLETLISDFFESLFEPQQLRNPKFSFHTPQIVSNWLIRNFIPLD